VICVVPKSTGALVSMVLRSSDVLERSKSRFAVTQGKSPLRLAP
jgi:hypothetical protein